MTRRQRAALLLVGGTTLLVLALGFWSGLLMAIGLVLLGNGLADWLGL